MNFSIVNKAISLIMITACLAFSFILFFTDKLSDAPYHLVGSQRIILGSIILLYSFFRGYRIYLDFKKPKRH